MQTRFGDPKVFRHPGDQRLILPCDGNHVAEDPKGKTFAMLNTLPARTKILTALESTKPTAVPQYPLIPIDVYAHWTRPDGLPLDPWLRTHIRMDAKILAVAPQSQIMTGSVTQWEAWTGMTLPASGQYVIPGGLSTLRIDYDADEGRYVEPNIWVQHR